MIDVSFSSLNTSHLTSYISKLTSQDHSGWPVTLQSMHHYFISRTYVSNFLEDLPPTNFYPIEPCTRKKKISMVLLWPQSLTGTLCCGAAWPIPPRPSHTIPPWVSVQGGQHAKSWYSTLVTPTDLVSPQAGWGETRKPQIVASSLWPNSSCYNSPWNQMIRWIHITKPSGGCQAAYGCCGDSRSSGTKPPASLVEKNRCWEWPQAPPPCPLPTVLQPSREA